MHRHYEHLISAPASANARACTLPPASVSCPCLFHWQALGRVLHAAARRAQRGAVPHNHKLVWGQLRLGCLLHQQLGGLVKRLVGQAAGREAQPFDSSLNAGSSKHQQLGGSIKHLNGGGACHSTKVKGNG